MEEYDEVEVDIDTEYLGDRTFIHYALVTASESPHIAVGQLIEARLWKDED